jgi:hypothetical protein
MMRGLVRYLDIAGMSPDAIRNLKPYVVRFVEDVRSGKETIDGIPVPVCTEKLNPDVVAMKSAKDRI